MSRFFIVVLVAVCSLCLVSSLFACLSPTDDFIIAQIDTQIDLKKLERECTEHSCLKNEDSVTIRSFSDQRIAITIGENGLRWVAPYKKLVNYDGYGEDGVSVEELNFKKMLREDLETLQQLSVVNIDEEKKGLILERLAYGYHFGVCGGVFKEWPVGGVCIEGKLQVPKCRVEASGFMIPVEGLR